MESDEIIYHGLNRELAKTFDIAGFSGLRATI
jgi:hypothetical protein